LDNTSSVTKNVEVPSALRITVWEMYMGPNVHSGKCLLCGETEISRVKVKQWEAAHIVAKKYHTRKPVRYDLLPACTACNNQCADICIFDYLLGRERYKALEKIIRTIYRAFQEQSPLIFQDELKCEAWRVLRKFYAGKQFMAGGGLQNQRTIYQLAQNTQLLEEREKLQRLCKKMKRCQKIMQRCAKRVKMLNE
jgi:hypothetical protein